MELERKSFFKGPRITEKVRRRQKRVSRDAREKQNKDVVRGRDNKARGGCSFPLCGCRKRGYVKHVAHLYHKSMGGNPKEDRSLPELMIQTCGPRHREHQFSIDQGNLQCRPLTELGTNGAVAWWARADELMKVFFAQVDLVGPFEGDWFELAREVTIGVWAPLSPQQREILELLADMEH